MPLNINFNFRNYLQTKLGSAFSVSNVRHVDGDFVSGKTETVITKLPSNVFNYHSLLEYQIDFYTDKPEEIETLLLNFVLANNGIPFVESFNALYPLFTTPTPMEKDIPIGTNVYTRLVIFAKITVFNDVSDISKIEIDGERIDFLTASLPYIAQIASKKVSGEELNGNVKEIASTQLTFNTVPKSGVFFFNNVSKVRRGILSGQTEFSVKLTFIDGGEESYTMIIASAILNVGRGLVPSLNITMALS